MVKTKKIFPLAVMMALVLSFLLFNPLKSKADQTQGIQISPLTYNLDIKPGGSKDLKLNVKNYNSTAVNYTIETELFSSVSDEGAPSFKPETPKEGVTTIVDWITFSDPKDGTLAASEAKDIHFNIAIPIGAEPGGHYAAVFVKQINKTLEGNTQLGVSSRVGALILASVPGATTKGAEISDFSVPKFVWKGPVDLAFKIKNTGSVHYDSTGQISIHPTLGHDVVIDAGTHTIIPDNMRSYKVSWDKKYPFGYYKLTASAKDGDGNDVSATATMWALPLIIVIPLLVFLALVIWLLVYLKRHVQFVK
ncbi:MAG: hypothetical protein NTY30_00340 [Candidatus Berkelbacteria bacterium]|nr:hypothetical protein [Candidatus Berkelbacteria bacterium]